MLAASISVWVLRKTSSKWVVIIPTAVAVFITDVLLWEIAISGVVLAPSWISTVLGFSLALNVVLLGVLSREFGIKHL